MMDRRDFLAGLGLGSLAILVPRFGRIYRPTTPTIIRPRWMLEQSVDDGKTWVVVAEGRENEGRITFPPITIGGLPPNRWFCTRVRHESPSVRVLGAPVRHGFLLSL